MTIRRRIALPQQPTNEAQLADLVAQADPSADVAAFAPVNAPPPELPLRLYSAFLIEDADRELRGNTWLRLAADPDNPVKNLDLSKPAGDENLITLFVAGRSQPLPGATRRNVTTAHTNVAGPGGRLPAGWTFCPDTWTMFVDRDLSTNPALEKFLGRLQVKFWRDGHVVAHLSANLLELARGEVPLGAAKITGDTDEYAVLVSMAEPAALEDLRCEVRGELTLWVVLGGRATFPAKKTG
jgi:hypothetical protein